MATAYRTNAEMMEAIERIKQQEVHELPASMEERARLLDAACLQAEILEESRIKRGLPPSQPAPWPESTREFMSRHARRFHKS